MIILPPNSIIFPYTTLFRSDANIDTVWPHIAIETQLRFGRGAVGEHSQEGRHVENSRRILWVPPEGAHVHARSEEHTSELQSHSDLVCRLLLEKKKY